MDDWQKEAAPLPHAVVCDRNCRAASVACFGARSGSPVADFCRYDAIDLFRDVPFDDAHRAPIVLFRGWHVCPMLVLRGALVLCGNFVEGIDLCSYGRLVR